MVLNEITTARTLSAKASKALDTMRARIVKAAEARAGQVAQAATEAATANRAAAEAWGALATHAATQAGDCRPRRRAGRTHAPPLDPRGVIQWCAAPGPGHVPPVGSG